MTTYNNFRYEPVVISSGTATSTAVDTRGISSITVLMPSAWTTANLGFKVGGYESGTFYPLHDDDGALIDIGGVDVDEAYTVPAAVTRHPFVKLWSHQSGNSTDTNQAATRTIYLILGIE